MTIQELIKTCDYRKTAEDWMKEEWLLNAEEKKSKKRLEIATERVQNFCKMLCGLTPKSSEYVLALPYIGFSREWVIEAELIKKEDFEKALELIKDKNFPIYSENDTEERLSEINKEVRTWLPIAYAYEFSEWEEILGAEVIPDNFERIGKDAFLSAVLYELSFNGMSRESHNEQRKKLDESIAETEAILKLPKEGRDKYLKSWDKIKKELGIDEILESSDEEMEEEQSYIVYDSLRSAEGWVRELKKMSDSYF